MEKLDFGRMLQVLEDRPVFAGVGGLLLLYSFVLVITNEYFKRRHLKVLDACRSSLKEVINVSTNEIYNNNLVFVYGLGHPEHPTVDSDVGTTCPESTILFRFVEVLQFRQKHEVKKEEAPADPNNPQAKTSSFVSNYTYPLEWSAQHISTSSFVNKSYKNDSKYFHLKPKKFYNPVIRIGAYKLNFNLIESFDTSRKKRFILSSAEAPELKSEFSQKLKKLYGSSCEAFVENGYLHVKHKKNEDMSGDMRISYYRLEVGPMTVIAKQHYDMLVPFKVNAMDQKEKDKSPNNTKPPLPSASWDALKDPVILRDTQGTSLEKSGRSEGRTFLLCLWGIIKLILLIAFLPFLVNSFHPRHGYEINWIDQQFQTKENLISQKTRTSCFRYLFVELLVVLYFALALSCFFFPIREQINTSEEENALSILRYFLALSIFLGNFIQFFIRSVYWIGFRNTKAVILFLVAIFCAVGVIAIYYLKV